MATPWKSQNQFYRKYMFDLMKTYRGRPDLQIFTEIILSLIAVIIFGVFAIKPTFVTVATLITDISEKERVIAILDEKIQNLSTAQNEFQTNSEALSLLDKSIAREPLPAHYIRQVEAAAALHSVKLVHVQTENMNLKGTPVASAATTQADTSTVPFPEDAIPAALSFTISGDFQNLEAFAKTLEELRMPLAIVRTSIITDEITKTLDMIIRGKLAYVKE